MIQTLDLFPPVVDDPYDYGAIAAANALSDVYAMGGIPRLAMNILCIPEDIASETVAAILRGGYEKVREAGAVICGGHSLKDKEPKYGLAVTGFVHPDRVLRNVGLQAGDQLLLTKPLGTGILNTAAKAGLLSREEEKALIASMKRLNRYAAECLQPTFVHACTDVTGFGLLGHLAEMTASGNISAEIDHRLIPKLPGAFAMAEMGIIPRGAYANRNWLSCRVRISEPVPTAAADLLFDPQTSGGLLIAVAPEKAEALLAKLQSVCPDAAWIGQVTGGNAGMITVV